MKLFYRIAIFFLTATISACSSLPVSRTEQNESQPSELSPNTTIGETGNESRPIPEPDPMPEPSSEADEPITIDDPVVNPDPIVPPTPLNKILRIVSPRPNQKTEGKFRLDGECTEGFKVGIQISGISSVSYTACKNEHFGATIKLPERHQSGTKKPYQIIIWQDLPNERLSQSVSIHLNVCPQKEWGAFAVNKNYEPDDAGFFCLLQNKTDDGRYNFHQPNTESIPRQIADPQIFVFGNSLYAVGGSPGRDNPMIYRSTDAVTWRQHGRLFRPDENLNDGLLNLYNRSGSFPDNKRSFRNIWAPEIFYDPQKPDEIQLFFTATESRAAQFTEGWHMDDWQACNSWSSNSPNFDPDCLSPENSHQLQTTMHASMSLFDFINNKEDSYFADDKPDFIGQTRSKQPNWMTYKNSSGNLFYDGGLNLNREIPTSVSPEFIDPLHIFDSIHWLRVVGEPNWWSLTHQRSGVQTPWTSMALDSSFFYDPRTQKRWVNYAWTHRGSARKWQGNHLAAYPLSTETYSFSTASDAQIETLAYKKNLALRVPGTNVPEGQYGINGQWDEDFGVAEGGYIFYNSTNDQYYSVFSRNVSDSQAYAMFGKNASRLEDLFLNFRDQASDSSEYRVVESSDRITPEGTYFGGGSVFEIQVNGDPLYYLAFHAKFNIPGVCEHRYCRTLYLKELHFDPVTGAIRSLSDSPSNAENLSRDIHYFVWPRDF